MKIYKSIVIGSGGTGKTALINRYIHSIFDPTTKLTIGYDFYVGKMGEITLQIWDFGGQSRFQNVALTAFYGAKAVIYVVDYTRENTLDTAGWKELLWDYEKNKSEIIKTSIIALNKIDFEEESISRSNDINGNKLKWAIDKQIPIVKTSAKTGQGVNDLFALLRNMIIYENKLSYKSYPINMNNITYIPDSWNFEKREKLNLIKLNKEEKVKLIKGDSIESKIETSSQISIINNAKFIKLLDKIGSGEMRDLIYKIMNNYNNDSKLISTFQSLSNLLKSYIYSKISDINLNEFELLIEIINLSKFNLPINNIFQQIIGYCYILLGYYHLLKDKIKAGKAFFNGFLNLNKYDQFLASKFFFLSCCLLGILDYDFFINQIENNQTEIALLLDDLNQKLNIKNNKKELDKRDFISLGLSIINVLDESNNDLDVIVPIENYINLNINQDPFDIFLHKIAKETLENINEKVFTQISYIKIQPNMLMSNKSLKANVTLQNTTTQKRSGYIKMISPGSELESDKIKFTIQPRSTMNVVLIAGRPKNYGDISYYFEVIDLDGFRKSFKEKEFYIAHPKQNLRIKEIQYDSEIIKEGITLIININIINLGDIKESCFIKIKSNDFKMIEQEYAVSIDKNASIFKRIVVGEPIHHGNIKMNVMLYRDSKRDFCDQYIMEFIAKRSWIKMIKKGLKKGLDIGTSII
ncbi:MAG: GTP-binding protein [Candidatus Lokiarchaeota archaeon]|nr:GTP-binding protein [Candidatus Lokiarchaeota archaeon]